MQRQRMRDGLRAVIWLASKGVGYKASVSQIALAIGASVRVLEGVFIDLKDAGVVEAIKGCKGGYTLVAPFHQHTFLELLTIFNQGSLAPLACIDSERPTPCDGCLALADCVMRAAWGSGFALTERILAEHRLGDTEMRAAS